MKGCEKILKKNKENPLAKEWDGKGIENKRYVS
jgi:hypothetical protein